MGITGLLTFISPAKKINKDISNLRGKIIIIDLLYVLHQKIIGKKKHNCQSFNQDGDNITHYDILLRYITGCLEREILPIALIDTKAHVAKTTTVQNRKQKQINSEDATTSDKKHPIIEFEIVNKCVEFLKDLGIVVIACDGEADPDCAMLANQYSNIVAGIVSNDSDILIYNAPSMINISFGHTVTDNLITYSEYNTDDVLDFLSNKASNYRFEYKLKFEKFTHDDFVNFAIMLGTDYHIDGDEDDSIYMLTKDGKKITGENEKLFKLFVLNDYSIEKTAKYFQNYPEEDIFKDGKIETCYYHIPENYLIKWQKIKNIYMNPTTTYIDDSIIKNFGHMKADKIKEKLGNIDSKYKDYVINCLFKIKKGYVIFKNMGELDDDYNSFRSCRLKHGQKLFKLHEDDGIYVKKNLEDVFNNNLSNFNNKTEKSDWTYINNSNKKYKAKFI